MEILLHIAVVLILATSNVGFDNDAISITWDLTRVCLSSILLHIASAVMLGTC